MKEVIDALSATELNSLRKLQSKAAENTGGTTKLTGFQRGAMQKAYDAAKSVGKVDARLEALATGLGLNA